MSSASIIVPVRHDPLFSRCLASIDNPDSEVVIVLNGASAEMKKIAEQYANNRQQVQVLDLAEPNLAAALEAGSRAAQGDVLIHLDSDCVFHPGAIAVFHQACLTHQIVKGQLLYDSHSWLSRITKQTREQISSDFVSAYKPGLAIRKDTKDAIGGYFFDGRIKWREDAELDHRIRAAGLPIHYEPNALITHASLTPWRDLKSAFNYGTGQARANLYGIKIRPESNSVLLALRHKGLAAGVYMGIWNTAKGCGILTESLRFLPLAWGWGSKRK